MIRTYPWELVLVYLIFDESLDEIWKNWSRNFGVYVFDRFGVKYGGFYSQFLVAQKRDRSVAKLELLCAYKLFDEMSKRDACMSMIMCYIKMSLQMVENGMFAFHIA